MKIATSIILIIVQKLVNSILLKQTNINADIYIN